MWQIMMPVEVTPDILFGQFLEFNENQSPDMKWPLQKTNLQV